MSENGTSSECVVPLWRETTKRTGNGKLEMAVEATVKHMS